jgi:hypothetical protein
MGLEAGVQIPGKGQDCSLLYNVQTDCVAHPAQPKGAVSDMVEVKRPDNEAYHSPPSSVEMKNDTALHVFMAWCLIRCRDLYWVTTVSSYGWPITRKPWV